MKSEHLQFLSVSPFSNRTAPVASTALDRWALARIRDMVATARVRFRLWDGFELPSGRAPVGTHRLQESARAVQLGLGSRSEFRRNLHVRRRRRARRPGRRCCANLSRVWAARRPTLVVVAEIERRARRKGERPSPLRPRERVLRALARPRDGLHVRVLSRRPTPRSRCAQIAKMDRVCRKLGAEAGRACRRSGLRLGLARAVHGEPLRRDGSGVQRLGRADRLRA